MNKSTILVLVVIVVSGAFISGCSNTNTPLSPTPVTFTQGHQATYQEYSLDTANGSFGLGNADQTTLDTVHQTLRNTNYTFQNRSSVILFENVHSRQVAGVASKDSTFYYQDANANLYIYDYGLSAVNSNPLILNQLGKPLHSGWVLLGKIGASVGSQWQAADTTLHVNIKAFNNTPADINILDTGLYVNDTNIVVGSETLPSKHFMHNVKITGSINGGTGLVWIVSTDTYVNLAQNVVLNVMHPSTIQSLVFGNKQAPGNYAKLMVHN